MKVLSYNRAGRATPGRLLPFFQAYPVTISMICLSLAVSLIPALAAWATWQVSAPIGLQVWLAHFTHWSADHLLWDILTFTFLSALLESSDQRLLIRLLLWAPPLIIIATWMADSHATYRGLSGLDSALYSALLLSWYRERRINSWFIIVCLTLFAGKSVYEIATESTLFVSRLQEGVSAVPIAHLTGAVTGTVLSLVVQCSRFGLSRHSFATADNKAGTEPP